MVVEWHKWPVLFDLKQPQLKPFPRLPVGTEPHMIRFVVVQNRQGKTRLSKWYARYSPEEKSQLERETHRAVVSRERRWANFIEYTNYKLVYRQYAGLFFTLCVDVNDNELAAHELIHLLVEVLDGYFGNVCELDLIFHFDKVYQMMDEIVLAGEISETSQQHVVDTMRQVAALE